MSQEELCERAEQETWELAELLRGVDTQADLIQIAPKLKKRFISLAILMKESRSFLPRDREPSEASEALFIELARLYERAGMREIIEKTEREAIALLDAS